MKNLDSERRTKSGASVSEPHTFVFILVSLRRAFQVREKEHCHAKIAKCVALTKVILAPETEGLITEKILYEISKSWDFAKDFKISVKISKDFNQKRTRFQGVSSPSPETTHEVSFLGPVW